MIAKLASKTSHIPSQIFDVQSSIVFLFVEWASKVKFPSGPSSMEEGPSRRSGPSSRRRGPSWRRGPLLLGKGPLLRVEVSLSQEESLLLEEGASSLYSVSFLSCRWPLVWLSTAVSANIKSVQQSIAALLETRHLSMKR